MMLCAADVRFNKADGSKVRFPAIGSPSYLSLHRGTELPSVSHTRMAAVRGSLSKRKTSKAQKPTFTAVAIESHCTSKMNSGQ
jgi:hypothetical protein